MTCTTAPARRRHSIDAGDLVLCNLPPYGTQPWLSMGVVALHAALSRAGLRARVVRVLDDPDATPETVQRASFATFTRDPPVEQRLAAMEQAYAQHPDFFDGIVAELLAGPERLFAFSVFRNNADVTLLVARLVKALRPDARILIGGPEAAEAPDALLRPWVDVVAAAGAEVEIVALVESLLEGRTERLGRLPALHLNPALGVRPRPFGRRPAVAPPAAPIDFSTIVPLFVGEAEPTIPVLLNWGCPHGCSFCSNRGIYGRFALGSVDRVLTELDQILSVWRASHPDGATPNFTVQFSDATTNAVPEQFDALLAEIAAQHAHWRFRPLLRGQTLFDTHRITKKRTELMGNARFVNTFFGLESGSNRLRAAMKKPGRIEEVADAMRLYHDAGHGGLTYGVPVGLPGETDDDFRRTVDFVDWTLSLEGTLKGITVLPYVFFDSAQSPEWRARNTGEQRGVLWRMPGPAGAPEERATRVMQLFETIDKRVETTSPLPPCFFLPAMLPDEAPERLDTWMNRFGRNFNQIDTAHARERQTQQRAKTTFVPSDPAFVLLRRRLEQLVHGRPPRGWAAEELSWIHRDGAPPSLAVPFVRPSDGVRFVLSIEAFVPDRPAFARSGAFNLTYLARWKDAECSFDAHLMRYCVEAVRVSGASAPVPAPAPATPST